jgi:conjugal transfer pilus assembly protein TraW
MRFYKTIITLAVTAVLFNVNAQQTAEEKALETLKNQEQSAQAMIDKYASDVNSLVPVSQQDKEKGHTKESFIDESAKRLGEISIQLQDKGLSGGLNQNGDAKVSNQRIEEGFIKRQQAQLDAYTKKFQANGMLDGFDEESIAKKTEKFKNAVQLLANQSQTGMVQALQRDLGFNLSPTQEKSFDPNALVEPTNLKAVFISFNMPSSDIKEMLGIAVRQGAQVFLKGMHPDDSGIHDTIRRLRFIGRDLDINPDVRFKPRYFQEFNINTAPTILIRNENGPIYASGITNLDWLESKAEKGKDSGYLGKYGDTVTVTEKDIRQEFKDRMAGMNFEGKAKKVVDNFWNKKKFQTLPAALKDDEWFIDPTVKAKSDIINPRGDQLATKGQVINPIDQMPIPLTLYVFDPTDTSQLEWVANNHRVGAGQKMLIFSQLDIAKGWKHLEALRTYFGTELYELPKEIVGRFNITHLPVRITTDMQRKLMRVEQFQTTTEEDK